MNRIYRAIAENILEYLIADIFVVKINFSFAKVNAVSNVL